MIERHESLSESSVNAKKISQFMFRNSQKDEIVADKNL